MTACDESRVGQVGMRKSETARTVVDLAGGVVCVAAVELGQRHAERLRHEQQGQENADRAQGGRPPEGCTLKRQQVRWGWQQGQVRAAAQGQPLLRPKGVTHTRSFWTEPVVQSVRQATYAVVMQDRVPMSSACSG